MNWHDMTQAFWALIGTIGRRMVDASNERLEWRTPIDRLRVIITQDRERAKNEGEGARMKLDA